MHSRQQLEDELDRARELLSHVNQSGDLAVLMERAVDALIAELEKIRCKAHNAPSVPRGARCSREVGRPARTIVQVL